MREVVSLELLEALAGPAPSPEKAAGNGGAGWSREDVAAWLSDHGLHMAKEGPWKGDGSWRWELAACPFNPDHDRGEAWVAHYASGAIAAGCHHDSCTWRWQDLRARNNSVPPIGGGNREPNLKRAPLRFRTAREIAATTPAEVPWVAEPWAATGALTEVDGKIKAAGKTTWVMALCQAVLDGADFMGQPTKKTPIVFLTEQGDTSLRQALKRAGLDQRDDCVLLSWADTRGIPWPDVIAEVVAKCEEISAGLIVVDTLPQFAAIKGDAENNSGAALEAMRPLQEAAATGRAVILIRHERKSGGDVGDSGRGSSAFAGTVDVVLSIRRLDAERPTYRVIEALSRFEETPTSMVVELTDAGYVSHGSADGFRADEDRDAVLQALPLLMDKARTIDDIVGMVELRRDTVTKLLKDLVDDGVAGRKGAGKKGDPYLHWRLLPPSTPKPVAPPNNSVPGSQPLRGEPNKSGVDDTSEDSIPETGTEPEPNPVESGKDGPIALCVSCGEPCSYRDPAGRFLHAACPDPDDLDLRDSLADHEEEL